LLQQLALVLQQRAAGRDTLSGWRGGLSTAFSVVQQRSYQAVFLHCLCACFLFAVQVLYNFLLEFSRFDWDHYCLSLLGPVPLKDLPKSSQGEVSQHITHCLLCGRVSRHL
jgi:hypothetical protein